MKPEISTDHISSENKTTIEELEEQISRLADFSLRRSGLVLELQDRIEILEREFAKQTANKPQTVKQSRISEDVIEKHYEDKMEEIDQDEYFDNLLKDYSPEDLRKMIDRIAKMLEDNDES
jgi:hypothetical protein